MSVFSEQAFPGQKSAGYDIREGKEWHEGMTLRDYFAAKAMNGHLAKGTPFLSIHHLVEESYEIADAMLEFRGLKQ